MLAVYYHASLHNTLHFLSCLLPAGLIGTPNGDCSTQLSQPAGNPKGVELSNRAVLATISGLKTFLEEVSHFVQAACAYTTITLACLCLCQQPVHSFSFVSSFVAFVAQKKPWLQNGHAIDLSCNSLHKVHDTVPSWCCRWLRVLVRAMCTCPSSLWHTSLAGELVH